jgi:hypothetical protein
MLFIDLNDGEDIAFEEQIEENIPGIEDFSTINDLTI